MDSTFMQNKLLCKFQQRCSVWPTPPYMYEIDIRIPTQYVSLASKYWKSVTINSKWQSGHYALFFKCHGKLDVPLCSLMLLLFFLSIVVYTLCSSLMYFMFTTLPNLGLWSDLTIKGKRLKNVIPEIGKDCTVLLSLQKHIRTIMSLQVLVECEWTSSFNKSDYRPIYTRQIQFLTNGLKSVHHLTVLLLFNTTAEFYVHVMSGPITKFHKCTVIWDWKKQQKWLA